MERVCSFGVSGGVEASTLFTVPRGLEIPLPLYARSYQCQVTRKGEYCYVDV